MKNPTRTYTAVSYVGPKAPRCLRRYHAPNAVTALTVALNDMAHVGADCVHVTAPSGEAWLVYRHVQDFEDEVRRALCFTEAALS